jgi:hypothetical protein
MSKGLIFLLYVIGLIIPKYTHTICNTKMDIKFVFIEKLCTSLVPLGKFVYDVNM